MEAPAAAAMLVSPQCHRILPTGKHLIIVKGCFSELCCEGAGFRPSTGHTVAVITGFSIRGAFRGALKAPFDTGMMNNQFCGGALLLSLPELKRGGIQNKPDYLLLNSTRITLENPI